MKQGKLWVTLYFSLTISSWRRLYTCPGRSGTNKILDSRGRPLCSVDGDGFYCTFVFSYWIFLCKCMVPAQRHLLLVSETSSKALWAAEYNAMCQHDKCKVCQVREHHKSSIQFSKNMIHKCPFVLLSHIFQHFQRGL